MINAAWLIPLLPLVGFLINALGKKWLSKKIVSVVACGSVLGSFVIAAGIFIELLGGADAQTLSLGNILDAGGFSVSAALLIDPLSVLMTLIITGIGFFIHVYSVGYMSHDEGFARYFSYLNLFVFSMLMLVLGANYILMFVGWEGVGFCSYLLIGFWFGDNANNDAAKKAFVMNRIGDVGFLTGVFLIFTTFGSIEYAQVFSSAADMPAGLAVITTITLLLFIGATGKSAQIPLFTWLPDAMAGPTPVSALIHAATMVTAGIYMIVRSNILFTLAPITMEVITYVGVATALLGAFVAITQNDIKKVLAYSTVSQLGYMFVAVGVGAYSTGMFHLITHAFFKALLFLGAGSVIHAMSGEQDIRRMGGLKKDLPVTYLTFLAGVLAIVGLPPFSGFFSKDEILAKVFEHSSVLAVVMVITFMMTAFYIFRMFFLVFFGGFRGSEKQKSHLHESPSVMTVPLIVLAVLAVAGGFINVPETLFGHHALANYLEPVLRPSLAIIFSEEPSHATEYMLMVIAIAGTLVMFAVAYSRYLTKSHVPAASEKEKSFLYRLSSHKGYIDEFYDMIIRKPLDWISSVLNDVFDKNVFDRIVNSVGELVVMGSGVARLLQTGKLGFYIFIMVAGITAILFLNFMF